MNENKEVADLIKEYEKRESDLKLDIEQLRQLNLVLKIAEEKSAILNSIIKSSDEAIVGKNLNGIITSWNSSAERIFGYQPLEIIGLSIMKLVPTHLQEEEIQNLEKLKKGIQIDHFETQRLRKDGTLIDILLTISPIFNSEGDITGFLKIAKDITQYRISEIDSRRLGAIIESSDDAIISKDLNSIVLSWNDSAQRIFGYTAADMIGQSILKLIPPNRLDEEPKILAQLRKGIRVDHFETERVRKDGSLINVSLTISPIKNKNGVVIGLSKIARDITDQKIIERQKDEFLGFVSHELKTPLTSLRSYIQIAIKKVTDHEFVSKALIRAELQTRKMEGMIRDFLTLSRFDDGKFTIKNAVFDIVPLIAGCITDSAIISTKHLIQYQGDDCFFVFGDAEKISMVLTNLINNAQKYSPFGGAINISCAKEGDSVCIKIKDEGIGISEDEQKKMFMKFHRVHSEYTKEIPGFGIGLYLVSAMLALHGSTINVQSELGKGSTFSFNLKAEPGI